MINITLDELKALYMNFSIHSRTGKIIHRLREFDRPVIDGGALIFKHLEDNENRFVMKLGKESYVSIFNMETGEWEKAGTLVHGG